MNVTHDKRSNSLKVSLSLLRLKRDENFAAKIVKLIFFCGWLVFAAIIVFSVFQFKSAELYWKIAISAFILLLPFSFFLQALFTINDIRVEKKLVIQDGLRKIYTTFILKDANRIAILNAARNELFLSLERIYDDIKSLLKIRTEHKKKLDDNETEINNVLRNKSHQPSELEVLNIKKASLSSDYNESVNAYNAKVKEKFLTIQAIKDLENKHLTDITNFIIFQEKSLYPYFRQAVEVFETKRTDYFQSVDSNHFVVSKDNERSENTHKTTVREIEKKPLNGNKTEAYSTKIFEFEIEGPLDEIVYSELKTIGLQFNSFLVPLSFFLFIYFTGFLITLPLIESTFTEEIQTTYIPISQNSKTGIPILVVQWGFLGGLVYTSISLLNRFLRKDIVPRVYFNSAFRLLFSAVVSVLIYILYIILSNNLLPSDGLISNNVTLSNATAFSNTSLSGGDPPAHILLLCFAAGVAPIQILIYYADILISKINKRWLQRDTAGNQNISQLEGVNSVTAQRLSEEGVDYVQQIALTDPTDISNKTKFPLRIVNDWKDQAVFYILTSDMFITTRHSEKNVEERLRDHLEKELGTRRISELVEILQPLYGSRDTTKSDTGNDLNTRKKIFFTSINLLVDDKSFSKYDSMFEHIFFTGNRMLLPS